MVNPSLLGSVLAYLYPSARPALDFAVVYTPDEGYVLAHWDAKALGGPPPTDEVLTATEASSAFQATRTADPAKARKQAQIADTTDPAVALAQALAASLNQLRKDLGKPEVAFADIQASAGAAVAGAVDAVIVVGG